MNELKYEFTIETLVRKLGEAYHLIELLQERIEKEERQSAEKDVLLKSARAEIDLMNEKRGETHE